ncbi:hypothetical protein [Pseudarthrobacter chlorophenolicus]|uniref:hypothetical protein n=1 Tax=Pseudarthrobacter chlorophenolicus TaxID=85085 RepID=UPI000696CF5F|nr:hypothetical protein [Pseudarthrobacter chlorophenolicus]
MGGSGRDGGTWQGAPDGGPLPQVRRSPSGRIPQWAIDEAFGRQAQQAPWRAPEPAPHNAGRPAFGRAPRPYRPRKRKRRLLPALGVALVICLYFTPSFLSRVVLPFAAPYLPGATVPPPGYEAVSSPLGTPPASTGSTVFVLQESPDPGQRFAAYDPCRPVHYVVRPDFAVPGGDALIRDAVAATSAATGLQFV